MNKRITKRWTRNESDALAVAEGYWFDEARGQFVVDWMAEYLRLYEGDWAGEPFECRDWQYEATMRLFGWVRHSDRWGRDIRRFRKASIWVPKKNKKSPTLAAWGLYLLLGDSEPGQKVFIAAKDGQQAREIAGKHAVEMMLASPVLASECSLNKNLMQITHERSRSLMRPLSSANSRTKESKEGINGSVLIDETHVVDRDFIARIARAGISRSEPLHIEVSTAGNNPDGYGKERYDYAKRVISGEHVDAQLLAICHEAPQDLTDGDLDADPVRWGKLANPAWDHTVGEEEYLADYNESKQSITALADFKMYRLDIWQRSSNPWLRQDDWAKCRREYTAEDLLGRVCGGGLDLSKTDDMTSLCLMFPEEVDDDNEPVEVEEGDKPDKDQPVSALWWYWLPKSAIDRYGHEVPYKQWAKDGWLTVVPAPTIEYAYVEHDIAEILRRYDCRICAFDEWYAKGVWENLRIQHGWPGQEYKFRQTITSFAGPTAKFERLVIGGKLWHRGNPITTWQAGHAEVQPDPNQNIRPVKPPTRKKVDGIVAGIMALDSASRLPPPSPYLTRGFATV